MASPCRSPRCSRAVECLGGVMIQSHAKQALARRLGWRLGWATPNARKRLQTLSFEAALFQGLWGSRRSDSNRQPTVYKTEDAVSAPFTACRRAGKNSQRKVAVCRLMSPLFGGVGVILGVNFSAVEPHSLRLSALPVYSGHRASRTVCSH